MQGRGKQGTGLAVLGVAFAAKGDGGPWDGEGGVDEEALEEGGGEAHFGVGDVVFAEDGISFFRAD